MKIHRFYAPSLDEAVDSPTLIRQWTKVLRFKPGQKLQLFDGEHEALFEIRDINKTNASLKKLSDIEPNMPAVRTFLLFSPVKRDGTDLTLQKATELGVTDFVPIVSERSNTRDINNERAQRIIVEAAEQCGRTDVPSLHALLSLSEALEHYQGICTLFAADRSFATTTAKLDPAKPRGIVIGPEGGWTDKELALLSQHTNPINLGQFTLRAETAAIVGIYALQQL